MLIKRLFDLFACIFLLVLFCAPFFLLLLAIKFTSNGSVFYWSTRVGKDNRHFQMPKFRTMQIGTPEVASHLLQKPADHLTPLGTFLRKTSLDEIPHLWSVLNGDMSIVGPRPLLPEYLPLYTPDQLKRHLVKPGITGLAQVNGRNLITWDSKFNYDKIYVENCSLGLESKSVNFKYKK
jgi:O-antigen biosynthesis protein WbqP